MASLNAQIPDSLKKALDIACAQREVSQKIAVAEALAAWISAEGKQAPTPDGKEDNPFLVKTREILNSEDDGAKRAIQENIEFFFDRLDRRKRKVAL